MPVDTPCPSPPPAVRVLPQPLPCPLTSLPLSFVNVFQTPAHAVANYVPCRSIGVLLRGSRIWPPNACFTVYASPPIGVVAARCAGTGGLARFARLSCCRASQKPYTIPANKLTPIAGSVCFGPAGCACAAGAMRRCATDFAKLFPHESTAMLKQYFISSSHSSPHLRKIVAAALRRELARSCSGASWYNAPGDIVTVYAHTVS